MALWTDFLYAVGSSSEAGVNCSSDHTLSDLLVKDGVAIGRSFLFLCSQMHP